METSYVCQTDIFQVSGLEYVNGESAYVPRGKIAKTPTFEEGKEYIIIYAEDGETVEVQEVEADGPVGHSIVVDLDEWEGLQEYFDEVVE